MKKNFIKKDNDAFDQESENKIEKERPKTVKEKKAKPEGRTVSKAPAKTKAAKAAKPGKKKGRGLKIALTVVGVIVLLVVFLLTNYQMVLGWFGINKDFSSKLKENEKFSMLSIKESIYNNFDSKLVLGDINTINILLFGLDENEERESEYTIFRPDTIILVSVNFETKKISMLSIPRDSYVPIYGRGGKDKINTCFYYGSYMDYNTNEELFQNGVNTLVGTVSDLLGGIPINYYVGVNMDTAAAVVDAIGGVYFELDKDVYLDDDTLFYTAQSRVWDGNSFINLARLRGYPGGDVDRTAMQQRLLKALFDAVKGIKLSKIPGVIKIAYESINTNIDMKTAVSFVLAAMDIDTSNITTVTMPGMFGNYYGISYWIINQSARVPLIQQLYGITASYQEQDPTLIIEYQWDENGHRYYLDAELKRIYVDDNGNALPKDENGNWIFPSEPDTPTEPTDPTDPTDPTEPTEPTEPTDPSTEGSESGN